ncbi:MAG: nuclear transport factor 2 family protein [Hyphomonadaceae bacterium]
MEATFASLISDSIVVNNPANQIIGRDGVLGAYRAGIIDYAVFDRRIEHAGKLGDAVIVMGGSAVTPEEPGPNAGKLVRRLHGRLAQGSRAAWKLAARQATVIAVE